jgi:hypothetical protein
MKQYRLHIIIIILLASISIGLGSYVSSVENRLATPNEEESLADSFDAVEDDATFMDISNQNQLYTVTPDLASDIINQVYAKQYEETKLVDRFGTIEGGVSKKNNTISFDVHFIESNTRSHVVVTVKNEATKEFDITVGDTR